MRLIAYSGTIVPDTNSHVAAIASRDVVDTALEFAIKVRRWFENENDSDDVTLLETDEAQKLSYPPEKSFLKTLHGIVHSRWLLADWTEEKFPFFSATPGKRIFGIMFETDKYPRKSVGLESVGLTYLLLRYPEFKETLPTSKII